MCFWDGFGATSVSTLAVYELLWEDPARGDVGERGRQRLFSQWQHFFRKCPLCTFPFCANTDHLKEAKKYYYIYVCECVTC